MKRTFGKIIGFCLSITILGSSVSMASSLPQSAPSPQKSNSFGLQDYNYADLPSGLQNQLKAANKGIAPSISPDGANDLTSFVVDNGGGKKTLYQYQSDVKFVDNDGNLQFIDNSVVPSSKYKSLFEKYAYENKANNIKTYFPQNIGEGVLINDKDINITMKPLADAGSSAKSANLTAAADSVSSGVAGALNADTYVQYDGAFGSDTSLQYAPINTGVKENLILNKYDGQNQFSFELDVGNLQPDKTQGSSINLVDPSTGKTAFTIGGLYVRDSYKGDSKVAFHTTINNSISMSKSADGVYTATVTVDNDFLRAATTVYPVTVDPSAYITSSNISSATAYSNHATVTGDWDVIGTYNNYGEARTYVRINNIQNYSYINPANITSASYSAYEGSGNLGTASVRVYNTNFSATPANVTWAQCSSGLTDLISQNTMLSGVGYNSFDVTILVQNWLKNKLGEGGYSQDHGFVLMCPNGGAPFITYKSLGSETYTSAPTLTINYTEDTSVTNGTYYIKNAMTGKYLDAEQSGNYNVIAYPYSGDKNQQWRVQSQGNGTYVLYNNWPAYSGYALDTDTASDITNADVFQTGAISSWNSFRMVKNSDGTYRIMSTYGGLYRALNAEMNDINAGKTPINCIFYPYDGTSNEKWVLEGGHKLSTPQIGQEQDQWCWDASAQMSALTYVSSVPSQSDIATHIFGSPVNQGITYASQIQDAANYASGFTDYVVSDVLSQTDLINQLNSGNPVILKRGWYPNDGSIRQGGHATIVYGYNFTSTGGYIFLIHDPWPTVSNPWPTNNAGQSYTRTYSEIVDGNTDGTDTGRWENSIYR